MIINFKLRFIVKIVFLNIILVSCSLKPEFNSAPLAGPPLEPTIEPTAIPIKIKGCMNSLAYNYNTQAELEDGTCSFKGCVIFDSVLKDEYENYRNSYPTSAIEDTCPAPVVDLFNQSNRPHVGILWVVDNSFSMEQEQRNLANNFNSFINEFINSRVEFTMGVTTTDGKQRPNAISQLTSEAAIANRALLIENFKNLVNVGTNGSSTEKGYQSSFDFLEQNAAKFLKSDSYLSVIYISDEHDQSNKSAQEYLDHMNSYVSHPHKVRTHAILDLDNSGGDDSSKGERYLYSVNKTGGIKGDVDANFAKILKDIGNNLINLKNMFTLSKIPYLPTLTVTLNGNLINTWTYNSNDNAILIDPVPDFSSEIKINYTPIQ